LPVAASRGIVFRRLDVQRTKWMKAYLEPSAINHAVDRGLEGSDLRALLEDHRAVPTTGLHTIYELARTFLLPEGRARGMALFTLLADLDPVYQAEPLRLLEREYVASRTGTAVIPVLAPLDTDAARLEVARLARGDFDAQARDFLQAREADVRDGFPRQYGRFMAKVERLAPRRSPRARSLRTFESVLALGDRNGGDLVREIMYGRISRDDGARMWRRLDDFPTLRTIARANAYLSTTPIAHRRRPALDKIDDYRHVIEASYCQVFITADEQLARTAPKLHPDLRVVRFAELIARPSITILDAGG
jgi:hypothetical protein